VQESPSFEKALNISYGILTIGEASIKKRLELRNWDQQLIKDNICWAKHLEKIVEEEINHISINTEENTPDEVAGKIIEWINN